MMFANIKIAEALVLTAAEEIKTVYGSNDSEWFSIISNLLILFYARAG